MITSKEDFFATVFQGIDGYVSVWDKQTLHTEFYRIGNWDKLFADAELRVQEKKDVYFGVCPLGRELETGRGKEEDVCAMTTLFADVDIASGIHSSGKKYPETLEKALEILYSFIKPSILVDSGGGVHAYWLLSQPIIIRNEADRADAKQKISRFQYAMIYEFRKHGYDVDFTGDLARVLRVPYTVNFKDKNNPKEVRIINE